MANVKRDRFVRIAEARTNKVIHMIRLLSNCANPAAYEYDSADIRKIFAAIDRELKMAKSKFSEESEDKFQLKS